MRKLLAVAATLGLLLAVASPVMAATVSLGLTNVAACKDTATVTVYGSSSYTTNHVKVSVYKKDSKGNYQLLAETTTNAFSSGSFSFPVMVDYSTKSVTEGTSLRIEVRLKAPGSDTVSGPITTYTTAADKYCLGKCSIAITTADKAPASGVVTLRSHFGSWFRPEGRLQGALPVLAGQALNGMIVGVPCDVTMRVWYYPATGKDRTPKLLPSQYWPAEYGTAASNGSVTYATSFKFGLPATKPLEADDPYAPK